MAFFRNPSDEELKEWQADLAKPDMMPYRDYPPWGLYRVKGADGARLRIESYYPTGFTFQCGSCDEDHTVPGPAVCVMRDQRFNLLPKGAENERGVMPVVVLEPCDLPAVNEPVGIAGSKWAQ